MSTIPLDKSWMNKRGSAMYINGVRQFQKFVEDNANGESLFPCPCVRCRNARGNISVDDISVHLLSHGIDTNYVTWIHHGENINKHVIGVPMTEVVEPDDAFEYPRMSELVDDVFLNMQTVEADDGINDLNDTIEECFGGNPEGGPELSCEPETVMNKKYQKYQKYSKDQSNDGWHVVLHTQRGLNTNVDKKETPTVYQSILKDNPT